MWYFFKKLCYKGLKSIEIAQFESNNTELNLKPVLRANCVQMKKAPKVKNSWSLTVTVENTGFEPVTSCLPGKLGY